jgi:hypothetical protein
MLSFLCFTWTNTCPLIAIPYIFSLVSQYYMFSSNESTFLTDVIIVNPTQVILVL